MRCRRSDGTTAADGFCGEKPDASESGPNYSGCTYSWSLGSWSEPDSTCSATAKETRTATCLRQDGQAADAAACATLPPPTLEQTVESYEGCKYDWAAGEYGSYDSTCSEHAQRSRTVVCERSDGTPSETKFCDPSSKPSTTETASNLSGCGYEWKADDWKVTPSCSAMATETRTVACQRSDGAVVADGQCDPTAKPATTGTAPDYTTCGFDWATTPWSPYDRACSDNATHTRTVSCRREDGTSVADVNCTGTRPVDTETSKNYAGCTYHWQYSDWTAYDSTCSAAAKSTRTATCVRTVDGVDVAAEATNCADLPKEDTSRTQSDYSGCQAQWAYGDWGPTPPASTCNSAYPQTRTATCQVIGADGQLTTVADSRCDASQKQATTQTVSALTGCSYAWNVGTWSSYDSTCSRSATRTRTVYCYRSDDPSKSVPPGNCPTPTPASSETGQNITDCGGTLTNGNFEFGTMSGWSVAHSGAGGASRDAGIQSDLRHSGSYAMGFPNADTGNGTLTMRAYQAFLTKAGANYSVSAWVYCFSSYCPKMQIVNSRGVVLSNVSFNNSDGNGIWAQKGAAVAGDGSPITIQFVSTAETSAIRVDDVVVSVTPP